MLLLFLHCKVRVQTDRINSKIVRGDVLTCVKVNASGVTRLMIRGLERGVAIIAILAILAILATLAILAILKTCGAGSGFHHVAEAGAVDEMGGERAEFLAETRDVGVDNAVVRLGEVIFPDCLIYLGA